MKSRRNLIYAFAALTFSGHAFSGCSEDEETPQADLKKAKMTISVSDGFSKEEGDDFSLMTGGVTATSESVDWKVDGKTEKGTVISITSDYVNGGNSKFVVESVQDFMTGSVTISSFNIAGASFTISYKIEVDGNVVDEQTVEIAAGSDAFYKNYQL